MEETAREVIAYGVAQDVRFGLLGSDVFCSLGCDKYKFSLERTSIIRSSLDATKYHGILASKSSKLVAQNLFTGIASWGLASEAAGFVQSGAYFEIPS